MDQLTLKYLRIIVPGFALLFGIYPIYNEYFIHSKSLTVTDYGYLTLIAITLGAIYHITNLQKLIVMPSNYFITKNIKEKLISMCRPRLTKSQETKISEKRRYMHVFYNLIDNDESLKRKGANVYFNGLFLTSTADIFLILISFSCIYKYLTRINFHEYNYNILFLIISFLSAVFHLTSTLNHIMLSNEQLEYIDSHKNLRDSVKLKFDEIL